MVRNVRKLTVGSKASHLERQGKDHWLTLDLWLAKDNRFLNPKSSYGRIMMAHPCRLTVSFLVSLVPSISSLSLGHRRWNLMSDSLLHQGQSCARSTDKDKGRCSGSYCQSRHDSNVRISSP
jgi:hypothetical protein